MIRNRSRRPAAAISALALAAFLAACGGQSTSTSTSTPSAVKTATAAPVAAGDYTDLIPTPPGNVAMVDGEAVTYAQLDEAAAAQLVRLKTQVSDARKKALDQLIDDQLIEGAAEAAGQSTKEWVEAEIDGKVKEPTDEDGQAFWDKNPRSRNIPYERVQEKVMEHLKGQGKTERRAEVVASLRENAGVEVFLQPLRFAVELVDGDPAKGGGSDAPIQIVEFSDFQCGFCNKVLAALNEVESTYGDKVNVTFKHFPLGFHKDAPKAAEAASCAGDQGKFWEMHDELFENQKALGEDKLAGYAEAIGLDAEKFAGCIEDGTYTDKVAADMAAGQAVGVSGTPAFFINGRFVNGALPFEVFKEVIDEELKAKKLL
jgi:protein-disulfide isomerase